MLSLLVFASCVFAATASRCCIPPQWEGRTSWVTTVVHEGQPRFVTGSASMAFDAINHKIGQLITEDVDGKVRELGVLLDYNTNTKYIGWGNNCIKTKLNRRIQDFGGCIPDNSTVVEASSIFGLGANSMDLVTYRMDYPGVLAYVALTRDSCVPVMELTRGTLQGNNFIENVHYLNISAGISSSDSMRSPPRGCEHAREVSASYTSGNFNTGLVGRRSLLLNL